MAALHPTLDAISATSTPEHEHAPLSTRPDVERGRWFDFGVIVRWGAEADIGWRAGGSCAMVSRDRDPAGPRPVDGGRARRAVRDARRGLDAAVRLPVVLPDGEVAVQDVLADEGAGYERSDEVFGGGLGRAADVGLWLALEGTAVVVGRLPGWAAYPRPRGYAGLFTLGLGQVGCWRANFRFTGCACSPSWYFEDWLVHVSNGVVEPGRFVEGRPDREVEQRVHLYGGAARSAGLRR